LFVWQRGVELVTQVYRVSRHFPTEEKYGLVSQIRRASVSVPANIAEGYGRGLHAPYLNHLSLASGSLAEVDTELVIASNLKYAPDESLSAIRSETAELQKMLWTMRRKIEAKGTM
jgi:four helix bundle protein